MGAIADEQTPVNLHAGLSQRRNFLEERHGVEDDPVADHTAASGAQYSARNQLQNELFTVDDDGMAGVVATGVSRNDGEILRKHVDDLAFTFVAPLGANNDRGFALQCRLHGMFGTAAPAAETGSHTLVTRKTHNPAKF